MIEQVDFELDDIMMMKATSVVVTESARRKAKIFSFRSSGMHRFDWYLFDLTPFVPQNLPH
jgi:hypothetical protein